MPRPSRTTRWSSASRTRITPAATARRGSRARSGRPAAARRAARRARACRSGRSRRRARAPAGTGTPGPLSSTDEPVAVGLVGEPQLDAVGVAVADDVRERLLGGAVDRQPRLGGERPRLAGDGQRAAVAEAGGERAQALRARACASPRSAPIAARASVEPGAPRGGARARSPPRPRGRRRGRSASSRAPSSCSASADSEWASTSCMSRASRGRARPARPPAAWAARDSRSSSTSASACVAAARAAGAAAA